MAYPFTDKVSTNKKSKWTNSIKWIVIHHTAWWTYESNVKYLSEGLAKASVHFVIWENGEVAKIWDPKDILWHAWNGSWWWVDNCNTGFLWIEVVWTWEYNIQQLIRLTDLVEYLMWVYKLDKYNIIRHSDCTQDREITRARKCWMWVGKVKKWDIGPAFFGNSPANWHSTFLLWRNQLQPRTESRYWSI